MTATRLQIESFFDEDTATFSHLVLDGSSGHCAIVDPVLGFDPASGRTDDTSARRLAHRVQALGARLQWILETHAHADHLSAAPFLKRALGGRIGIGERIREVQRRFGELFNEGPAFARDGSQFDRLFPDGECFAIGSLQVRVMHTPGHTPACLAYVVEDQDDRVAFVGDTLFMPDYGTARCDFPGGSAATLYRSIQKLLSLPPQTRLFMCHDYPPDGRAIRWETTVAEERRDNIHVRDGIDEATFVAMRQRRDATLGTPRLMLPAIQVNIRAGGFPPPEDNGISYLKIPVDGLDQVPQQGRSAPLRA
ncbi:MBL fold metallo-hydrolase [Zeimonas arvi]|uniref:MBL fold metallo-hydrolase n=1 Tax=Zeimonas arvi TaxID=2498847 RepID=A0A5C8P148_9BURK|nr:MBL fold metallo-hydrolase [Zeimonas arvi]TXL67054.1 MBL fold metallo-hydrolase [Zeimonas arvi]